MIETGFLHWPRFAQRVGQTRIEDTGTRERNGQCRSKYTHQSNKYFHDHKYYL